MTEATFDALKGQPCKLAQTQRVILQIRHAGAALAHADGRRVSPADVDVEHQHSVVEKPGCPKIVGLLPEHERARCIEGRVGADQNGDRLDSQAG